MIRDNRFYDDDINSEDHKTERLYRLEQKVDRLSKANPKVKKTSVAKTVYVSGGSSSEAGAAGPHALSGLDSPHTGTLSDSQAPQFLKTDGSRILTGSLTVNPGVTVDGVDLDVLEILFENHLNPTSDDHPQYATSEYAEATRPAKEAYKLLRTITAGDGLSGGGILTADLSLEVNKAHDFTWTGDHSFTQTMYAGSIMPHNSDTYDLGSSANLWRKIWGSELSAVVFSQYEQVLLGGWFTVSKGEGTLPTDILSSYVSIDLGANTFEVGDIIVFRGISALNQPQMEYMQVGELYQDTTYWVTRDFDGSGANDWPAGTVFANYGQTGDGRIELNAYDSPRISVFSHADTVAGFREQVRIGDLLNGWGYSASTYGAVFGAYEPGKANITIDPTNGIRLRNYNKKAVQLDGTRLIIGELAAGKPNVLVDSNGLYIRNYTTEIIKLTGTKASFENVLELGTNGRLQQGTGTWGTDFTGSAIWNESGVMSIGGWENNVKQWWGGSDGAFYANEGFLVLDKFGLLIRTPELDVPGVDWRDILSINRHGINIYNSTRNLYSNSAIHFVSTVDPVHPFDIGYIYGYSDSFKTNFEIIASENGYQTYPETRLKIESGSYYRSKVTIAAANSTYSPPTYKAWLKLEQYGTVSTAELSAFDIALVGDVTVNGTIKDGNGVSYVKIDEIRTDGWIPTSGWTINDATIGAVNVSSGALSVYSVGDKVKLTNGTVKYFYIVRIEDNYMFLNGGSDYVLSGAYGTALSSISYSHAASPVGFPQWFNWTPTLSVNGGTAPTYTATFVNRYCRVGKLVTIYGAWHNVSGGIAGAGVNPLMTSLPIAAVTNTLGVQIGTGGATLGTAYSVIGVHLWDSTHVRFTTLDWGNVTGADQNAIGRALTFTMMYEAA